MDISDTLAPTSDQLDAVDLLGREPVTFTVARVTKTRGDQPISIHFVDFPRVWRPSKTMRRVLGFCWGMDASQWAGRRAQLYCDPTVQFGGQKVGGIRIKRLSHIAKRTEVPILLGQGRGGSWIVEPLPDEQPAPARDWRAEADALTDRDALGDLWRAAPPDARPYIHERAQSLAAPTPEADGPLVTAPAQEGPEPEGWA